MESQKRQGAEYEFYGKLPLKKAIPLGLQHVLAMFVGNLTPILIITGACGIAGEEFGGLQVDLLQNAMLIAGIVTPINSTPPILSSIILFTALLPAPPTPITMIFALVSASVVLISSKVVPPSFSLKIYS